MADEQQVDTQESPEQKPIEEQLKDVQPNSFRLQMPINTAVFWVGLALVVSILAFIWMAWRFDLLRKAIPEFET